jgi:hypothetical protein
LVGHVRDRLLSAEAGVATLGFLLAYELALAKDRARTRMLAVVPALSIIVAWQLLYKYLDYGAFGSGGYIDPVDEPLAFLLALPGRYGSLLATVGVALVLLVFLISPAAKSGAVRFGTLAVALACLPLAASIPVERLLVLVSFGTALVCGELINAWLLQRASLARALAAALVVMVHAVIPASVGVYVSSHLGEVLLPHSDAYGPTSPTSG